MRLVLAMVLAGLAALPLSASAQAGEQVEASEPDVVEAVPTPEPAPEEPPPSPETAPEEPALQLKLDDAGLELAPSPPRTPDGYTLEQMELRVKRALSGSSCPLASMFLVSRWGFQEPPVIATMYLLNIFQTGVSRSSSQALS